MSHAPKDFFLHKNLGQLKENGGDFDLVEIWKNSSETRHKKFRFFHQHFLVLLVDTVSMVPHLMMLA